ncbi:MAG: hypothetical protein CL670_07325 [Balneola sp.]|jgi:RES domain-containing protein|nr:hypothetical protein [Balneola sp.]MBE78946.1 hypothetical protein [Balneola sp.]|tara:strand:+ start:694 stop:1956 length:1263 start_codon:yes stop_codon:yes gene_type:complete
MGFVKQNWIESMERGWNEPDTFVCESCIEDEFLSKVVGEKATSEYCSYCDNRIEGAMVAALADVMPSIAGAMFNYFGEPGEAGLPRDSGAWVMEDRITDTYEALLTLGLSVDEELMDDICNSFTNDAWVPAVDGSWLGEHEHEVLSYSWSNFTESAKHISRYFIFQKKQEKDNDVTYRPTYTPKQVLNRIGEIIVELSLWKELPANTTFYRVRKKEGDYDLSKFTDIGPPPRNLATAGRMNPAGISYGYFSNNETTAILEMNDTTPSTYVVGKFELREPMIVVDLTDLPPLPSIFENDKSSKLNALIFLKSFVEAISTPVTKDGREHIDYVPSQIVSEFFAQVLLIDDDKKIDATIYPSSIDKGHTNLVIFPKHNINGQDDWEKMLELKDSTEVEIIDQRALEELINRKKGLTGKTKKLV